MKSQHLKTCSGPENLFLASPLKLPVTGGNMLTREMKRYANAEMKRFLAEAKASIAASNRQIKIQKMNQKMLGRL